MTDQERERPVGPIYEKGNDIGQEDVGGMSGFGPQGAPTKDLKTSL